MRRHDYQKLAQKAAQERREYREGLSPTQQLQRLDDRLGRDVGAQKERSRLKELELKLLEQQIDLKPKNANKNKRRPNKKKSN